ncbi:MAG TPA: trypsin-like peptidase domain-containing protein, partial [Mycobacterium sp.]
MTEYLDPTRLREVRDTAIRVLAEPQLRPFLFEGIMHEYFTTLPIQTSPAWQIRSDLGKLNTVERLVDSTVPLEIWLYNAAGLTSEAGARAVFQQAKDIVTAASSGAPDVGSAADPAELPEAYIFSDDTVAFPFLAAGVTAGASVGRLAVPPFESGAPKLTQTGAPEPPHGGTGWLVAPTLLMTNHHVVNARSRTNGALELAGDADLRLQAAHTVVSFDFDSDPPSGQPIISTDVSCIALVAADPDLDYAILRIPENAARPALALWPRKIAATVDDNLPVNVIQHPAGKATRI